jgi:hypothetical protein
MSRNRNTYKNITRNTDTRLTALAAPSVPCFILPTTFFAQFGDGLQEGDKRAAVSLLTIEICFCMLFPNMHTNKRA